LKIGADFSWSDVSADDVARADLLFINLPTGQNATDKIAVKKWPPKIKTA
jgi:hypothetical protein